MKTCVEDGCDSEKIVGRGMCTRHYQQWRKANAPECIEDGCHDSEHSRGLCPKHYQRWRARQHPSEPTAPAGEWLPVVGYEGLYVASSLGQVRSLPRNTTRGQLIRQRHDPNGYLMVTLSKNGEHVTHRVHILVLTAFRGVCPFGKEGAHDDGDKDNCRLDNLFWKTRSENIRDIIRHGNHHQVNKTHCKWNHEFTKKNTRWDRGGHRVCRRCDNTRRCQKVDCKLKTHDHEGTPWQPPIPY